MILPLILDETENIEVRSGAFCVHSWFQLQEMRGGGQGFALLCIIREEATQVH